MSNKPNDMETYQVIFCTRNSNVTSGVANLNVCLKIKAPIVLFFSPRNFKKSNFPKIKNRAKLKKGQNTRTGQNKKQGKIKKQKNKNTGQNKIFIIFFDKKIIFHIKTIYAF